MCIYESPLCCISLLSWLRKLNTNFTSSSRNLHSKWNFYTSNFLVPHPETSSATRSRSSSAHILPLSHFPFRAIAFECANLGWARNTWTDKFAFFTKKQQKKLAGSFTVQSTRLLLPFLACTRVHICQCACNIFADYSCPPTPPQTHKTSNAGTPTSVLADLSSQISPWVIGDIAQKGIFTPLVSLNVHIRYAKSPPRWNNDAQMTIELFF